MVKLRDDWDTFKVDGYYAQPYTPHRLLAELYWDTCQRIPLQQGAVRTNLVSILKESQPRTDEKLVKAFEYAIEFHGIECEGLRQRSDENPN